MEKRRLKDKVMTKLTSKALIIVSLLSQVAIIQATTLTFEDLGTRYLDQFLATTLV